MLVKIRFSVNGVNEKKSCKIFIFAFNIDCKHFPKNCLFIVRTKRTTTNTILYYYKSNVRERSCIIRPTVSGHLLRYKYVFDVLGIWWIWIWRWKYCIADLQFYLSKCIYFLMLFLYFESCINLWISSCYSVVIRPENNLHLVLLEN